MDVSSDSEAVTYKSNRVAFLNWLSKIEPSRTSFNFHMRELLTRILVLFSFPQELSRSDAETFGQDRHFHSVDEVSFIRNIICCQMRLFIRDQRTRLEKTEKERTISLGFEALRTRAYLDHKKCKQEYQPVGPHPSHAGFLGQLEIKFRSVSK
jgi:hypothetical protein